MRFPGTLVLRLVINSMVAEITECAGRCSFIADACLSSFLLIGLIMDKTDQLDVPQLMFMLRYAVHKKWA